MVQGAVSRDQQCSRGPSIQREGQQLQREQYPSGSQKYFPAHWPEIRASSQDRGLCKQTGEEGSRGHSAATPTVVATAGVHVGFDQGPAKAARFDARWSDYSRVKEIKEK